MKKKPRVGGEESPSPSQPTNLKPGIFFAGMAPNRPYPAWLYHDLLEPIIVHNATEAAEAREAGYAEPHCPMTVNPRLVNWHWDLEDFTAEQMVLFAKEEFDIELPVELGVEKLFKAIWELMRSAPLNKNRIILMAQTIEMKYDATQDEIRRMIKKGGETTREEFFA